MVTDNDELLTLVVGENADPSLVAKINQYIESEYDLEIEIIYGNQPVYDFIIGVE